MNEVYVFNAGRQIGPLSTQRVLQCLAEGEFALSDLAWHEGLAEWTPLSSIEAFAPKAMPPPLPKSRSKPSRVPEEIMKGIRSLVQRDHPSDFATQRFLIEKHIEAYLVLQQLSPPEVPPSIFATIALEAATDHPSDYSTQLFIIEKQIEAYIELHSI